MTVDDFRRIALRLEGAEEKSHMGQPDFRVGGEEAVRQPRWQRSRPSRYRVEAVRQPWPV